MKHLLRSLLSYMLFLAALPGSAQVTDTSAWWAHMTGNATHGISFGVYGTLGQPGPNNTPGTRYGVASNFLDKDGNILLFGGHGVDEMNAGNRGMNDLWRYNIQTNQWTWVGGAKNAFTPGPPVGTFGVQKQFASTNWPGGRAHFSAVMDSKGNGWVFGGMLGFGESSTQGYLNDLWQYDVSTGQWAWMHGSKTVNQYGIYGTMGTGSASNTPGARGQYVMWIDKNDNIWIYGGNGYGEAGIVGTLSDLWKYSIKDGTWTWVSGAKTTGQAPNYGAGGHPGARQAAVGWTDDQGRLYIFGGVNTGRFSDLWRFDPATNEWSFIKGDNTLNQNGTYGTRGVPDNANKPGGRYVITGWKAIDGTFWMYGGYGYAATPGVINYLSDVWRYNPNTNQWTWMKGANTNQTALGQVAGTKTVADFANTPGFKQINTGWVDRTGNFWVYGGGNDNGYCNALWRLAPEGLPQPGNFIVSKTPVCQNETSVVYRINKVAGATSYEWTYLPSTGVTINGSDTSVTLNFGANASSGTLRVVAKDGAKASPPRDLPITVNSLPVVPNITGSPRVCIGATTTLANTTAGGTWISSNTAIATVNNSGVVTGVAAGRVNISYRVVNASNCTTTVATPVDVYALPLVTNISGTTNACIGSTSTLSNGTAGGTWLSSNAAVASVSAAGVVTGVAAGTVTISYRVVNANNCTTTVSVPFTVNALPTVSNITGTTSVCVGGTTNLSSATAGGTWLSSNTAIATVNNSGVVTGVASGTATISYRVVNANNCTTTVSVNMNVLSLPTVSLTPSGTQSICQGDSLRLTAGPASGVQYEWKRGTTNVGTNSATYYASVAGTYSVTVNNGSCAATASMTLNVNPLPQATVNLSGNTEFCEGDSVVITAPSAAGVSYQWKNGNTNVGTNANRYAALTSGSYKVVVRNTTTQCVDSSAPVDVTVYTRPSATLAPGDTAFCEGSSIILNVNSADTSLNYRWKNGSNTIPQANADFIEVNTSGVYSVVVSRSQITGCADSTNEITVTVHPLPVVNVTWDGETLTATPGHASYQWQSSGQNVPGATNDTYVPGTNGGYQVAVTDSNGCENISVVVNLTDVSVSSMSSSDQIRIYPNPTSGVVLIEAKENVNVEVIAMDGRLISKHNNTTRIDLSQHAAGAYLLRISDLNSVPIKLVRVIKQNNQ